MTRIWEEEEVTLVILSDIVAVVRNQSAMYVECNGNSFIEVVSEL